MYFHSVVPKHEGQCKPTWLNSNAVFAQLNGGVTGFFKRTQKVWWWPWPVKYGEEFHGIIRDNQVYPTKYKT